MSSAHMFRGPTKSQLRESNKRYKASATRAVELANEMMARASQLNVLCIQLVRTMNPEGVVIIPSADLKPAHRDDVLDVTVLENGDLRLGVSNETLSNPDMHEAIKAFQEEMANGTRTIEPAASAGDDGLAGDTPGAQPAAADEDEGVRGER